MCHNIIKCIEGKITLLLYKNIQFLWSSGKAGQMSEIVQWCVNCFFHPSMIVPYIKSQCIRYSSLSLLGLILWAILSLSRSFWAYWLTKSFNFFGLGEIDKTKVAEKLCQNGFLQGCLKALFESTWSSEDIIFKGKIDFIRQKTKLESKVET